MRTIRVGTFNLNNLFSRFDFKGQIDDGEEVTFQGVIKFQVDKSALTLRTFDDKLVRAKKQLDRERIAERIRELDLDVLAVQEVEDLDTLRTFVADDLRALYPFVSLVEGNDDRLIDVGLLSKLPLGPVTSWRHFVHADAPGEVVFSRDLAQVEVLDPKRKKVLFTIFNNHLKSKLVLATDPPNQHELNDARRRRQADGIAQIVRARLAADAPFIITGDMNDAPEAATLAPIRALEVVDGLAEPLETREYPNDPAGNPATTRWTHRFEPPGQAAHYEMFDQIWLSSPLADRQTGAFIDRRTLPRGNGSDHDPAWVELELDV
jgi:endonuclease/exonuclease/phosphatase family metal-dependent hydrolase